MAAGEDQPQPVVLDALVFRLLGLTGARLQVLGEFRQRRVKPGAPAHAINGFEAAGRHEPGSRIGRHTIPRPTLYRLCEGIVQRLLGGVKVAEQANQGGKDLARFGAVDGIHQLAHPLSRVLAHCREVLMLRVHRG